MYSNLSLSRLTYLLGNCVLWLSIDDLLNFHTLFTHIYFNSLACHPNFSAVACFCDRSGNIATCRVLTALSMQNLTHCCLGAQRHVYGATMWTWVQLQLAIWQTSPSAQQQVFHQGAEDNGCRRHFQCQHWQSSMASFKRNVFVWGWRICLVCQDPTK